MENDRIWYVVGAPQQSHFDEVFAIARRMGVKAELRFVPFTPFEISMRRILEFIVIRGGGSI